MPTIAILGGECSGKTTLATDLSERLEALVVSEELRRFVDQHHRTPTRSEQAAIMQAQQAAIAEAVAAATHPWVISDPAPAMTAVYSQVYFDDASLWDQAREQLRDTDYLFWCDIDVPWVADGLHHDGPHMRRAAHRVIADLVDDIRTRTDHPIITLSGTRPERIGHALQVLAV